MSAADLVVRFFLAVDRRDWPAVRAGLTEQVEVDYSSLSGAGAETVAADELIDRWRGLLPGFDATQHHLGPLVVATTAAGTASIECTVRGYHRLGSETWLVAGWYALTAAHTGAGWRLSGITLHTAYQEGDLSLPEQATARATSVTPPGGR